MKIQSIIWVFALACFFACKNEIEEKENATYQVVKPYITDTIINIEYVSELAAIQNIEIRSMIKGYIDNVYVDEGQRVIKGQLLFSIRNSEYLQELKKSKAKLNEVEVELKAAEIELVNSTKLYEKSIIGKPELELVKTKLETIKARKLEAESGKEQAELNLSYTKVLAPFDGFINRIPYKIGSIIEDGTVLTKLSNNKEIYAYFHVSEIDYLNFIEKIEKQNFVSLLLANNSLYENKGIIETTESEFDKNTGNIAFRAKFTNPKNVLKHGASGKILFQKKYKNAMLIPQKSTFELQENVYVFVVDEKGNVKQKQVKIIAKQPQVFIIEPTLNAEDKILFEGIQKVKDGDVIKSVEKSFIQLIKNN